MNDLIKNATISINTSECYETYGFTNVESITRGTPVIVSNIGAFPEVVKDGRFGYLVEPKNDKEFVLKINKLRDKNEIIKLENNCRQARFTDLIEYVKLLDKYNLL